MKSYHLLLIVILIATGAALPNVRAAPTLTITPGSVVASQGTPASYDLTLSGGTPNATYTLTLSGLPIGSVYSFSPVAIGPSGSSTLVIQSGLPNPLYCPGSYSFMVTATNTIASSDFASTPGAFVVSQSSHPLFVSVSTDNSTYTTGENVTITITTDTAARGTLTITTPTGAIILRKYQFTGITNFVTPFHLNSTSPLGQWTVNFSADDYCGLTNSASKTFTVIASTPNTTTASTTATRSMIESSTTAITATSTTMLILIETGNLTSTYTTIVTTAATQTTWSTATQSQAASTNIMPLWKIEHPYSEVILAVILILSLLVIIRRVRPSKGGICVKCGFRNPSQATSYCINCGERLNKRRAE